MKHNKRIKIETKNCNGLCDREIPLDENNFFKIEGEFMDICIKCSELKRCGLCFNVLEADTKNFHMNQTVFRSHCKKCNPKSIQNKLKIKCNGNCDKYKFKSQFIFVGDDQEKVCKTCSSNKICGNCGYVKPKSEFSSTNNSCNYCENNRATELRNKEYKSCRGCGVEFHKRELNKYFRCRQCMINYINDNKKCSKCDNILNDKICYSFPICNKCRNDQRRNRYKNDEEHRQREKLRSKIRKGIMDGNEKTIELIGCNRKFALEWLRFTSGNTLCITTNNSEECHIDHVMPISSFNTTNDDEKYECFNWRNMRLCDPNENMEKTDKIIDELIEKQKVMIKKFLSKFNN